MNDPSDNKNQYYPDLFREISSPLELNQLKNKLWKLNQSLYLTDTTIEEKIDSIFSPIERASLIEGLTKQNINLQNLEELENEISQIDKDLSQIPTRKIIVPKSIPANTVQKIAEWFFVNTNQQVIIDLQVDSTLIGGIVLVKNGIQYDYSLNNKLDNMWREGKFCL